jgi:hypothetical protein
MFVTPTLCGSTIDTAFRDDESYVSGPTVTSLPAGALVLGYGPGRTGRGEPGHPRILEPADGG